MRRRLEAQEALSRFSKNPSIPRAGTKGRFGWLAGCGCHGETDTVIMICRSGERDQMAGNDDNCFFILVHKANREFVAVRTVDDS